MADVDLYLNTCLDHALVIAGHKLPPALRAEWVAALAPPLAKIDYNTPQKIAAFMGQASVESNGFMSISEDLYYRADTIVQEWPSRFNSMTAESYAMLPEKLANFVYANELGNGDVASGDGYRYRARGVIGVTGKAQYEALAKALDMSLTDVIMYMETKKGAAASAVWWWTDPERKEHIEMCVELWEITELTRIVNGGTSALQERLQISNEVLAALKKIHT